MSKPKRDLRAMRIAARDGDHNAAKALLRLFNFDEFAREIKPGKPYSRRVQKAIDALTGAVGTEWEKDLLSDPPPRRSKAPNVTLFDD
jgi:hypothetical protein